MTDAAGAASFKYVTLKGTSECELVVDKTGFVQARVPYAYACSDPPRAVTNTLKAVLAPSN
jgi:hypothetical protein